MEGSVATPPALSKEELRMRLKQKIRDKGRSGQSDARRSLPKNRDIQTTLLSMGVDDPTLLSVADKISKLPHESLKKMKKHMLAETADGRDETNTFDQVGASQVDHTNEEYDDDDDDEELPPA